MDRELRLKLLTLVEQQTAIVTTLEGEGSRAVEAAATIRDELLDVIGQTLGMPSLSEVVARAARALEDESLEPGDPSDDDR